jgi:hypothetical protein
VAFVAGFVMTGSWPQLRQQRTITKISVDV